MTISMRNYHKDFRTLNVSTTAQQPVHIQPTNKPLPTMQTKIHYHIQTSFRTSLV